MKKLKRPKKNLKKTKKNPKRPKRKRRRRKKRKKLNQKFKEPLRAMSKKVIHTQIAKANPIKN